MKNLDDILKKVTERYGLQYNPNEKGHKVQSDDGTLENLSFDHIEEIFDFSFSSEWIDMTGEMLNWNIDQLNYDQKIHQKIGYNLNKEPIDNTQDYVFVDLQVA
ncbi:TPA: hypothetical protein QCX63_000813 [Bacillus pacificus]|uniref:hypothetical protein n=1 Tax=Bacillus pacificus TaxID=2026187 RepID=UPI002E1BD8D6|nr:hypothetical protein [Bacillus pacificus]HDR7484751.1 hypothetical protein [Bacillus pacificus]